MFSGFGKFKMDNINIRSTKIINIYMYTYSSNYHLSDNKHAKKYKELEWKSLKLHLGNLQGLLGINWALYKVSMKRLGPLIKMNHVTLDMVLPRQKMADDKEKQETQIKRIRHCFSSCWKFKMVNNKRRIVTE